jgi:two-component system cell cycle sensor histidine kinase/response regulator CckA
MKIKNQFIICIVAFTVVLLIIAASIASTEQQVTQLTTKEQLSNNIEQGASSLNSIAIDYFLYQENLQFSRWQTQLTSLYKDLSNLNPNGPQQQTLKNNVEKDLQSLNQSFSEVDAYLQTASRNVSIRIDPAFQLRWSSMAVQSQTLAFDASQLSNSLDNQAHQTNNTNALLIVSLAATFGAFLTSVYLIVFRRTIKSVAELQNGINTIGAGNLDHTIKIEGQNEITELSNAFNQMTANLKTVTATKTELENEIARRKNAETALRTNEQRWATTLASIGDAVIATDLLGKVTFMNGVAQELTGWNLSDASMKPIKEIFKIINEQNRKEIENPVNQVLEKGIIIGLANHTILIQKDGTEVPIDDSGAPIKDKDNKTTGVVLIFRDITERKKAEQTLRDNEVKFRTVSDFTYDWEYWIDPDGHMVYVSPSCKRVTGYEATEFIKDKTLLAKIVHPEDKTIIGEHFDLVSSEELHDVNFRIITRNGEIRWISHACRAVFDDYGKWIGRRASNRDVTDRKKVDEKMRESEERFSKAFHNSPVPQMITRYGDWRYVDANESVLRLLEYSREELIGHTTADLDLIISDKRDIGNRIVNNQNNLHDFEINVKTKSGKILTVLASTETIMLNGQKHLINTFIDITQRKAMQAKLEEYSKHLEDLVEERTKQLKDAERLAAIGATAGMVGHDIRNPLQAITSDLYLAKTDLSSFPESEEKNNTLESLQEIEKNIDYINKIVADLQDFARPLNPHLEEANIRFVINELLSKNGVPKNIKVSVKVDSSATEIVADCAYLKRILNNLVTNAIQAMPDGGKLTIHAYKDKKTNEAVITVKDTGVGIPETAKDKLFTPMFTTKSKGQGFGLAVIKRMTEALNGNVTFKSKEGNGTKFTIRLPQNINKKTFPIDHKYKEPL